MLFPGCLLFFILLKKRIATKHSIHVSVCIFVVADSGMGVMGGFACCWALTDLPCVDFASPIDSADLLSGFICASNVRIRPCALLLQPVAKT